MSPATSPAIVASQPPDERTRDAIATAWITAILFAMDSRLALVSSFLVVLPACTSSDTGGGGSGGSGSTSTSTSTTTTTSTSASTTTGTSTTASTSAATTGVSTTGGTSSGTTGNTSGGSTTGTPMLDVGTVAQCDPGSKPGAGGNTDAWANDSGVLVNVRMPDGYDPTIQVPLVVVYAPAGADAALTEQFTGLTPPVLAQGWAVAYVDHISPMTVQIISDATAIPGYIADNWCIDPARIYLTGHSDGGTIAEVSVNVDTTPPVPRAAAPSAAGVTGTVLMQIGCPDHAVPMMIMHSSGDQLFPISMGFGADAAQFWVGCDNCQGNPVDDGTCQTWSTCDDGTSVVYCQGTGVHGQWPGLQDRIVSFFASYD